tara:strand:+ start:59 stop:298 length:240 start_codon:yes stop_codon:yes gene_type:complete
MKWVLFVVLMTPDGSLDKVYNSASGWEDRIKCNEFVEFNHPKIIDSVKTNYAMPQGTTIMGIGCLQPLTNQEDMVKILD